MNVSLQVDGPVVPLVDHKIRWSGTSEYGEAMRVY